MKNDFPFEKFEKLMQWLWIPVTLVGISFTIGVFIGEGIPQTNLNSAVGYFGAACFFILLYWIELILGDPKSEHAYVLKHAFGFGAALTFVAGIMCMLAAFMQDYFYVIFIILGSFLVGYLISKYKKTLNNLVRPTLSKSHKGNPKGAGVNIKVMPISIAKTVILFFSVLAISFILLLMIAHLHSIWETSPIASAVGASFVGSLLFWLVLFAMARFFGVLRIERQV